MPAEPMASTTCTASGHPPDAISGGAGRLPVPAASSAARPRQIAAIVRKRGANTARRPPAPIASPMTEALSASPSDRPPEGPSVSAIQAPWAASAAAAR